MPEHGSCDSDVTWLATAETKQKYIRNGGGGGGGYKGEKRDGHRAVPSDLNDPAVNLYSLMMLSFIILLQL
jgi:hypothetical protein